MTVQPELFRQITDEDQRSRHAEYLTGTQALAAYTLTEMPADLRKMGPYGTTYEELAGKHRTVLERSQAAVYSNTDREAAKVAQLDLLFMLGCYLPEGQQSEQHVPAELRALLAYNAKRFDLPTHMDYDMVVDVNSSEFLRTGYMRTFSDGDEARTERDFYLGHFLAEPNIKAAAFMMKRLIDQPETPNKEVLFDAAARSISSYEQIVRRYGRMSPDHFAYFRKYLLPYADGTRNASGTFLPSVQLMELTMHKPSDAFQDFLCDALPYFPAWARDIIDKQQEASLQGKNIFSMLREGKLQLSDTELSRFLNVVTEFKDAKLTHMGVAFRQIPAAFAGGQRPKYEELESLNERTIFELKDATGTGGYNVTHILGNGVTRMIQLETAVKQYMQTR